MHTSSATIWLQEQNKSLWKASNFEGCKFSQGAIKIEEILREAELNFKMEYIFPDLKSPNGRPLRFDFVIFDDDGKIDFIIEYQGK